MNDNKKKRKPITFGDFLDGFFFIGELIKGVFFVIPRTIAWIAKFIFKIFD
ncbi:hypothetical protein [Mammaliicoccus vitulinus]|uniref:hypothetical protein n=1 Tax=Mammaliicoccus vitulinus TaxID=71237 RepID=UPI001304F8C9|nr:hypothetical protein [Mammaliicoccus vitulinus]MEB7657645.1 hypothetical protein [Mammaliicoccus vitulinus]QQT15608.1 hypothetical protein I6J10_01360 [Mammaliicoccus vitulinus]QQY19091.1 hypothetical protein I6J11_10435 [Mammaliicoccus vitulinus]WQK87412.1 hypothetical protein P3U62_10220 [Mammaliicoccus vitulinus]GGI00592.1 hypothetical protein GCM10007366_10920 [Mammaliicoccus vitulinus]